jgi:hypothetical protein
MDSPTVCETVTGLNATGTLYMLGGGGNLSV